MTVENCLNLSKSYGELGKSQLSLIFLERAKQKVQKFEKYKGMEIVGFKIVPKIAPKPIETKIEEKQNGRIKRRNKKK